MRPAAWCWLVLLLALWIDEHMGEPPSPIHPVVWMGNYLKLCGSVTVRCAPAPAFLLGALAWWVGAAGGRGGWAVQALLVLATGWLRRAAGLGERHRHRACWWC
jgi:adenosylcobinamide-phosphate synthase